MPAPLFSQVLTAVTDTWACIDPARIQVGGPIGHRLGLTARGNLLQLDWDGDFLEPFRAKSATAGNYVGLGKTLAGLIRLAYHFQDTELLKLKNHVVGEVIAAQDEDGYLGIYIPQDRIARVWDVHEMAYLLDALVADWRYFAREESLRAAVKLGNHLVARVTGEVIDKPDDGISNSLAFLGLDRALLALYGATGDERYLRYCRDVLDLESWDLPIVEGRHGALEGHAYAYLTRALAQAELYRLTGNEDLLDQSRRALHYLLNQGGLVITGISSINECWHSDQTGCGDLGETCATAYLIRLCDSLFRMTGDTSYVDLLERSLYNALFGAQSADGRQLRYYVPFEGERVYWDLDTYCCPGNFRRIVGELPEMLYVIRPVIEQDNGDGGAGTPALGVNLYAHSTIETVLATNLTVRVRQETDYPASGIVRLHVEPSKPFDFAIELRKPVWCENYSLNINGEPFDYLQIGFGKEENSPNDESGSGVLRLERTWQSGDVIDFSMAMPVRFVRGFAKQEGRVAVMAGPVLYTLNPKRNPQLGNAELAEIVAEALDAGPLPDAESVDGGTICLLRVTHPDAELTLTEFPDPDGTWSYFRAGGQVTATDDTLLHRKILADN